MLRLGLDYGARPPGIIVNVPASRQVGGFVEIRGSAADYTFSLHLSYRFGVAFLPALVGRFRYSGQQATDFSTPEKTEAYLEYCRRQGEIIRTFGCSDAAADRIVDYQTWWPFLNLACRWLSSHRSFVFELTQKCLRHSPERGEWRMRVRRKYPFLFWRTQWLAWLIFRLSRKSQSILKRLLYNN